MSLALWSIDGHHQIFWFGVEDITRHRKVLSDNYRNGLVDGLQIKITGWEDVMSPCLRTSPHASSFHAAIAFSLFHYFLECRSGTSTILLMPISFLLCRFWIGLLPAALTSRKAHSSSAQDLPRFSAHGNKTRCCSHRGQAFKQRKNKHA